jgi:hypothetical protein
MMVNKKINQEELWCEYSDMPSPISYSKCADYDSMGNYGRFPKIKDEKLTILKRLIQKLALWLSYKLPNRKRKSIWDL